MLTAGKVITNFVQKPSNQLFLGKTSFQQKPRQLSNAELFGLNSRTTFVFGKKFVFLRKPMFLALQDLSRNRHIRYDLFSVESIKTC
jgi:hypothetical protein